jgi:hypothetical protein
MAEAFLVLAVLLADGSVAGQAVGPQQGITKANAARIQPGMTRKQVQAILGGPAQETRMHNAGRNWVDIWTGARGKVRVAFDTYYVIKPGILHYFSDDAEWLVTSASWRP